MLDNVNVSTYVDREMRTRIKRRILEDFHEPVEQTALLRALVDLWLDGCIPLTDEDVQPYRNRKWQKRVQRNERECA